MLKVALYFGYLAIHKTIKVQVYWLDHQHRYYGIISKGTISKSFCLFKPFIWNWILNIARNNKVTCTVSKKGLSKDIFLKLLLLQNILP